MNGKSTRRGLGLILVFTMAVVLSARPVVAGPTLGMVVDNVTQMITVFNADTDAPIGSVGPIPNGSNNSGDCVITADRHIGYVTNFQSQIFQVDLTQSPPVLRSGVNPIVISNLGEDLSLSPRGEFPVVCDGSANAPGSVILPQKRLEFGTFNLGSDCNSVEACQNSGSTNSNVLVTSFNQKKLRRITLDSSGKTTITPDSLSVISPQNVNCDPQGTAGIVLFRTPSIESFLIPGLTPVDTRTPTGGNPISGVFNPAGTEFYVRSGPTGGNVDAFTFNPTTAALGATPSLTFAVPGTGDGNNIFYGMEQMALNPAGTKIYVTVPGAVNVYDTSNGNFLHAITDANISGPTGVCLQPKP